MFCSENVLLQIFALEGFAKACPVGLTDSYQYIYIRLNNKYKVKGCGTGYITNDVFYHPTIELLYILPSSSSFPPVMLKQLMAFAELWNVTPKVKRIIIIIISLCQC